VLNKQDDLQHHTITAPSESAAAYQHALRAVNISAMQGLN
jgi:hypothetical protein